MSIQSLGSVGGPPPQTGSTTPVEAVAPKPAPAPEVVANAPQQEPSREQVKQAVESIRKSVEAVSSNSLQISIDDESGRTVVRITDRQTGETLRQIPSVEALELARSLDRMQGKLVQEQA